MQKKNIENAIPGGKYGCALLLKYYYSKHFEDISLGKIIAMVKKSLEDWFFIHHKTLIYPNNEQSPVKNF